VEITKHDTNNEVVGLNESKIIKLAQLRYNQTKFPSKDPQLNYLLGFLQGYRDAREIG
jgi:hypothetical protein